MKRKVISEFKTEEEIIPLLDDTISTSTQVSKEIQFKKRFTRGQIQWLLNHCKKEIFYMSIAFFGIITAAVINLSIPFFVGKLVDSVREMVTGYAQLTTLCVTLFFLLIAMAFFNGLRHYFIFLTAERIILRMRRELFQKILEQDIAFFDEHMTGELMNRLSSDTTVLQLCVSVYIEMAARCILDLIGAGIILIILSWRLLAIMLLVVPFVAVGAAIYQRFVGGMGRDVSDELAKASEIAQESISNIRSVRSLAQEYKQMRLYNDRVDKAFQRARSLSLAAASFTSGMMFSGGVSVLLVLAYGGTLVLNKEMTMGELSSFIVYSGMIALSLSTMSGVYFEFLKSMGATERVYSIITRIPSIPITAEEYDAYGSTKRLVRSIPDLIGEIHFKNVVFSYPQRPDHIVLHGLDLDLLPGRIVALVGESGGGKSTCAQLIQRFYDPDSGSITLDNVDLREIDPKFLRSQIGVVSQEPYLFGTTIKENIKYSRENATDEEVIEAACQANAHEFISNFPQGYDTLVGERGAQLSGGQKQRVAIAQAILKKPKILLLDEATSALDSESEYLVQQALDRLMQGKTVLIIAHRLSTVRNADVVCVMKQGVIVERGTHQELINNEGIYKQLVEKQLLGEKRTNDTLSGKKDK